jgi:hypothetical protein
MKNLFRNISILIICLGLLSFFKFPSASKALAQIDLSLFGGSFIEEQIDLTVSPRNPKPGDEIRASIEAYGTDLNRAQISWYVNGTIQESGIGITEFKTRAQGLGSVTTIEVRIRPAGGGSLVTRSYTVSAQTVDIFWDADSFTPPFYKGKGLYATEGTVTFVAMPNLVNRRGAKIDPSTLVYKWSVDDRVLGSKSGYGRNTLEYTGTILGQNTIVRVEVTATDGTSGEGIVLLSPHPTKIVAYENNPLYGILFNRAIVDGFKLRDREIRMDAYPYHFSTGGKTSPNLIYSWAINDTPIPVPTQKNSAVFRNTNATGGTSKISVGLTNNTHFLQETRMDANINF